MICDNENFYNIEFVRLKILSSALSYQNYKLFQALPRNRVWQLAKEPEGTRWLQHQVAEVPVSAQDLFLTQQLEGALESRKVPARDALLNHKNANHFLSAVITHFSIEKVLKTLVRPLLNDPSTHLLPLLNSNYDVRIVANIIRHAEIAQIRPIVDFLLNNVVLLLRGSGRFAILEMLKQYRDEDIAKRVITELLQYSQAEPERFWNDMVLSKEGAPVIEELLRGPYEATRGMLIPKLLQSEENIQRLLQPKPSQGQYVLVTLLESLDDSQNHEASILVDNLAKLLPGSVNCVNFRHRVVVKKPISQNRIVSEFVQSAFLVHESQSICLRLSTTHLAGIRDMYRARLEALLHSVENRDNGLQIHERLQEVALKYSSIFSGLPGEQQRAFYVLPVDVTYVENEMISQGMN